MSTTTTKLNLTSGRELFLLAIILLLALWIRWPRVNEGMPFFYREDEAHHYNRIANMVKSGDLNPHYFHKPSLHFYLRIPVHSAAFIWNVREGNIRSIHEVITRDEYGVGDYAFSASQPGLVKWNRAFTVMLSVLLVLITYLISKELAASPFAALVSASLVASSPALIADSAVIGVDVPMSLLVLVSSWCSLRFLRRAQLRDLAYGAIAAGLAISTKYNALPIAFVPLLALCMSHRFSLEFFALTILGIVGSFLLASPYLVVELPLFLDQLAYEVWHYGIAAHEGNSAEPGLSQAVFYLRWLNFEAVGPLLSAFGTVGVFFLLATRKKEYGVIFLFPILFAALMISQRTNFPRNMLVIVPFVSLIGTFTLLLLLELCNLRGRVVQVILALFVVIGIGIPAFRALTERTAALQVRDSRHELAAYLTELRANSPQSEIAVSGQLQLPSSIFPNSRLVKFDQKVLDALELYERGFEYMVAHKGLPLSPSSQPLVSLVKSFSGTTVLERIVKNPQIDLYSFNDEAAKDQVSSIMTKLTEHPALGFDISSPERHNCAYLESDAAKNPSEDYCWISRKHAFLKLIKLEERDDASAEKTTLFFTAMSPWDEQKLTFSSENWSDTRTLPAGVWEQWSVQIPTSELLAKQGLFLETGTINSPKVLGLSTDQRRLGVAIKRVSLVPELPE